MEPIVKEIKVVVARKRIVSVVVKAQMEIVVKDTMAKLVVAVSSFN